MDINELKEICERFNYSAYIRHEEKAKGIYKAYKEAIKSATTESELRQLHKNLKKYIDQ